LEGAQEIMGNQNKSIWIVLPAYNAAETLVKTFSQIPISLRSNVLLVDDCSTDETLVKARQLGLLSLSHSQNMGYGANQKTCYKEALRLGAEVVIMLHPDDQYDARVVEIMADLILLGNCDVVLGNRIRTRREALNGGMPRWRYFLNRSSTFIENTLLGQTVGDFHSGLRAYSREVLETIPFDLNRDSFVFDQEFLIQAVNFNFRIADIPIPARYEKDSSSISFRDSMIYGYFGFSCLISYFLHRSKLKYDSRFVSSKVQVGQNAK
jgi:glycosyltransferase involved in cell wall biosynthesis